MATAYVIEWPSAAVMNDSVIPVPRGLPLRVQTVTFTTTTPTTNAIGDDCQLVEVLVTAAACFKGAASPTATTSDAPLVAEMPFYFMPPPGGATKLAFITR